MLTHDCECWFKILFVLFPQSGTSCASPKKYPVCPGMTARAWAGASGLCAEICHSMSLLFANCFGCFRHCESGISFFSQVDTVVGWRWEREYICAGWFHEMSSRGACCYLILLVPPSFQRLPDGSQEIRNPTLLVRQIPQVGWRESTSKIFTVWVYEFKILLVSVHAIWWLCLYNGQQLSHCFVHRCHF